MLRRTLLCALLASVPARAEEPPRVLTLAAALQVARESHPQLRQAEAAVELARGVADATRAPLLPQVGATAAYQRTTANFVFRPGNNPNIFALAIPPNSNKTFNFYNLGLTANQLLYDFGFTLDTWRASKTNVQAQQASQRTALLVVEFNLRNAFFTARANKASLAVADETVANQRRHLDQIQAFVEVGTRPEIDLAQARADLANARVQRIQAENAYDVGRATLNQAMGIEASIDYEVADDTMPELEEEELSAPELLMAAAERRPELSSLVFQVQGQRLNARASKGQFGPALNATGALTEAGTDISKLTWNWNLGASLTWSFSQAALARANLRQARANLTSLQAQADLLRQQILLQLEQARLAVRAAQATLEAQGEVLENARIRYGLAEGRYEEGVGTIIELQDAQLALTTAEMQRVQAEYNVAIARAQLMNALGRSD